MSPLSTLPSQISELEKRLQEKAKEAVDKSLGKGTWDKATGFPRLMTRAELEVEEREENFGVGA